MALTRIKLAQAWYSISEGLHRKVIGRTAGGLPDTAVRTLEEASHKPKVAPHLQGMVTAVEPTIVRYPFPEHFPPSFRRDKAFDRRYIYRLTDVNVSAQTGMVWGPEREGMVFSESMGDIVRIWDWARTMPELMLDAKPLDLDEWAIVVPNAPFYHFIWETLPSLMQCLEVEPSAKLLVAGSLPKYITAALDLLLGPSWRDRQVVSPSRIVRAKKLIMPALEAYAGFTHPTHLRLLQQRVGAALPAPKAGSPERLYISRRLAPKRALAGEAELEKALEERGFAIVLAEKLTLAEQMQLFAGAGLIVAPHGAGLSHLAFCQKPPTMLELFPPGFINDCYARLTLECKGRYDYLFCTPTAEPGKQGAIDLQAVLARTDALLAEHTPDYQSSNLLAKT